MVCPNCGASGGAAGGTCPGCRQSLAEVEALPGTSIDPELTHSELWTPGGTPSPDRGALHSGQRFTTRYTILKLLGTGGMGEVYQAWDEVLGAPVALKVIRPQLVGSDLESQQLMERFRSELRMARQVTHPNVIRIHDLGEVGETRFLTMQFVQGSDLGMVLRREGKLPVARALAIARQMAAGLAAVHSAGIIHRDLKPANIMLDEHDCAHLTDFGIARALDARTIQTLPGAVVGTLAYMAPEQARGKPADQRSDIYAFGLILYEMLAGGRPRTASDSALASLIERVEKAPAPLSAVVPDIPADLDRLVARCLAVDPADRYPTVADLATELDRFGPDGRARLTPTAVLRGRGLWLAVGASLVAVLITAAGFVWFGRTPPAVSPAAAHEPLSVIIADFKNGAQDPVFDGSLEQALGVAIEGASFITSYQRRPGVRLDDAGARLLAVREGIGVVLAGTITRSDNGYELRVDAVNPSTGDISRTASARAANKSEVLQAVDTIARSLRRDLGDTTPPSQLKAETFTAATLDAMKSYTIAQTLSATRKNEEAIQHYRKAIEQDPQFGRAYAGWALATYDSGRREEARQIWSKAIDLLDGMTERERYRTLGNYYLAVAQNTDKAIENYEKLVSLYPADFAGHNNLAVAYFSTLRFADALRQGRRAIDLYPKAIKFRTNFALYGMYAGDFDMAAENARLVLEEDPGYVVAYLPVATKALVGGDSAGAGTVYDRASTTGQDGASLAAIGLADIALFERRYQDAAAALPAAIDADNRNQNAVGAAAKLIALAEAQAGLGRPALVLKHADAALAASRDDATLVAAARLYLKSASPGRAEPIIQELAARLSPQPRAYARILQAERAIARGQAGDAMDALAAARKLADVWLGRLVSGIAYETFGHRVEARDEFDTCSRRLGEASAVFLDDIPTFRYVRTLREWQQRVRAASRIEPGRGPDAMAWK